MQRHTAVVFDMDGVLIDSEPVIRQSAQQAAAEFDRTLTDALYADLVGLPGPLVESRLQTAFGADFPMADYKLRFQHYYRGLIAQHGMPTKPGIPALIAELHARKVPLAVATQTYSSHAQAALAAAGLLGYFPVCVTGDQVSAGKPAPEIYLRAASLLATAPAACIALEDSDVGARAAVSAGMWTLMVPDFKPPTPEVAALVHEILASIPEAALRVQALLALR